LPGFDKEEKIMLIDPGSVFFSSHIGEKWADAIKEMVSSGLSAGMGIPTPAEVYQALYFDAWSGDDGALHLRALSPWGRWATIDAPASEWVLAPGGLAQ
jgi:hypothetical protein